MYKELVGELSLFFVMAATAITVQNAVFSRSLGISRLISLVDDTTDTLVFGTLLTVTLMTNTLLGFFIEQLLLAGLSYADYIRPLSMVISMIVIFLIVFVLCAKLSPSKYLKNTAAAMPMATFNCMVIGTLLLSVSANHSLVESLGFAFGSSVGFTLAVMLVTEVQRKLQNRSIPAAFKGLPATLLFLAALALALYGLTGFSLSL